MGSSRIGPIVISDSPKAFVEYLEQNALCFASAPAGENDRLQRIIVERVKTTASTDEAILMAFAAIGKTLLQFLNDNEIIVQPSGTHV